MGILVAGDIAVAFLDVTPRLFSSEDSEAPFLYSFSPINAVIIYSVLFFVSTAVCNEISLVCGVFFYADNII